MVRTIQRWQPGYFYFGRRQEHTISKYRRISPIVFPYFTADSYMMRSIGTALLAMPLIWRPCGAPSTWQ